jgi:hypothetical protein
MGKRGDDGVFRDEKQNSREDAHESEGPRIGGDICVYACMYVYLCIKCIMHTCVSNACPSTTGEISFPLRTYVCMYFYIYVYSCAWISATRNIH